MLVLLLFPPPSNTLTPLPLASPCANFSSTYTKRHCSADSSAGQEVFTIGVWFVSWPEFPCKELLKASIWFKRLHVFSQGWDKCFYVTNRISQNARSVSLSTTVKHVDVTSVGATVTGYGGELPGYGSANPQCSFSPVQPNGFSLVSQHVSTLHETDRFRKEPLFI